MDDFRLFALMHLLLRGRPLDIRGGGAVFDFHLFFYRIANIYFFKFEIPLFFFYIEDAIILFFFSEIIGNQLTIVYSIYSHISCVAYKLTPLN